LALGPDGWMLVAGTTLNGDLALFSGHGTTGRWARCVLLTDNGQGAREPYRTWSPGGLAILGGGDAVVVLFRGAPPGGVVVRTADGFRTWTSTLTDDRDFYRVAFADSQRGWLAGGEGTLWRTEDGGVRWRAEPNPGDVTVSCLAF